LSSGFTSNGVKTLQVPKVYCARIVSYSKGVLKQINCDSKTKDYVFETKVTITSIIKLLMLKATKAKKENRTEESYKASIRTSLRAKI